VETYAGTDRVGEGAPVALRGDVGEVVLWLSGRGTNADVEVEGDPNALALVDPVTRI
jgi:hypothetical protein